MTPSNYRLITLNSYVGMTQDRFLLKGMADFLEITVQMDEKPLGL